MIMPFLRTDRSSSTSLLLSAPCDFPFPVNFNKVEAISYILNRIIGYHIKLNYHCYSRICLFYSDLFPSSMAIRIAKEPID